MEFRVEETLPKTRIVPRIGQLWRRPKGWTVYMRVPDTEGKRFFSRFDNPVYLEKKDLIYSINLNTGRMIYSEEEEFDDYIVLEQIDPVRVRPASR